MRLERIKEDYPRGFSSASFISDFFYVEHVTYDSGERTIIKSEIVVGKEIAIPGHHNFNSDELCFEQFTEHEILEMLIEQAFKSFNEGKQSKSNEFKKILGISSLEKED